MNIGYNVLLAPEELCFYLLAKPCLNNWITSGYIILDIYLSLLLLGLIILLSTARYNTWTIP